LVIREEEVYRILKSSKFSKLEILGAILLFIMLVLVSVQVITRYIFNNPISWTEEMARFILVWITFIGAAISLKQNQHVKFEYLLDKLSPRIKKVVETLGDIITGLFLLTTIFYGVKLAVNGHEIPSVTLEFIRWSYVYASVPVGLGIMFLIYALKYNEFNRSSISRPLKKK